MLHLPKEAPPSWQTVPPRQQTQTARSASARADLDDLFSRSVLAPGDLRRTVNEEERLYTAIERVEDGLLDRRAQRAEVQHKLRSEVERLQSDVTRLQGRAIDARGSVEAAQAAQDRDLWHRREEAEMTRKQVASIQRNVQDALDAAARAQRFQEAAEKMSAEKIALTRTGSACRSEWESAVTSLNKLAMHVEALEAEKLMLEQEVAAKSAREQEHVEFTAELRKWTNEERHLQQELQQMREARELQELLEEERGNSKIKTSTLVQEMAEMENSTDVVERRYQRRIEQLRSQLEQAALDDLTLQQSKQIAEERLRGMWAAMLRQKQEQLRLQDRSREEEAWTAHLQTRADALVEELRLLEAETNEGVSGLVPGEMELEEEMWRQLTFIRQQRRALQQSLALLSMRSAPLKEALAAAEAERRMLLSSTR